MFALCVLNDSINNRKRRLSVPCCICIYHQPPITRRNLNGRYYTTLVLIIATWRRDFSLRISSHYTHANQNAKYYITEKPVLKDANFTIVCRKFAFVTAHIITVLRRRSCVSTVNSSFVTSEQMNIPNMQRECSRTGQPMWHTKRRSLAYHWGRKNNNQRTQKVQIGLLSDLLNLHVHLRLGRRK